MDQNLSLELHWQDQDCVLGNVGPLYHAYRILSQYGWIPAVILGVPGNVLIVLIAQRKHNRRLSPSVYMSAMAIVDTVLLIDTACFHPIYYEKLMMEDRGLQYIGAFYVVHTCGTLSGFYLVAISVDRLIAVRYPLAAVRLCTPSRAMKVVTGTTILIVSSYLHFFFTVQYVKDDLTDIENLVIDVQGNLAASQAASWYLLLTGTIIPFIIIIGCNIGIIITLRKAAKRREAITSEPGDKKAESSHLTRMLIFISMAYLVVSIPYRLYIVVLLIPEVLAVYDLRQTCFFVHYNMTIALFFAIWCWNPALNFYLYCVGGGKRYRKDTKEVIMGMLKCKSW